ncbi:hypothetical protein E1267_13640 [Nonomuraea longispora]|uniref:SH3 domain-containing protein n=1 Tax=Nonomuraea longispora TaxID=1848320 RepID=A0A4R4NI82_9ACTN|nr:hypothetical protein [Nonomuraea longispora]TDC07373.1 hypothetical protein E1267_13640 [Nonomuraea longispora]
MRNIVGRIASVGTVALAASAALVMAASSAQAAGYWSKDAPRHATGVGNLTTKSVTVAKRTYTLQLRAGKWGANTYIWARVPKNSGANGNNVWLSVYNPSTKKWQNSPSQSIKNTTYSQAHRAKANWLYKACTKQPGLGGSAAKCTSTWKV